MGTTNTKKPQSNILDTLNWQEEVVESMYILYVPNGTQQLERRYGSAKKMIEVNKTKQ
jgi:hypothetical protein